MEPQHLDDLIDSFTEPDGVRIDPATYDSDRPETCHIFVTRTITRLRTQRTRTFRSPGEVVLHRRISTTDSRLLIGRLLVRIQSREPHKPPVLAGFSMIPRLCTTICTPMGPD